MFCKIFAILLAIIGFAALVYKDSSVSDYNSFFILSLLFLILAKVEDLEKIWKEKK